MSLFWSAQLLTPSDAGLCLCRCWDINANTSVWWVIRGPVILSILVSGLLPCAGLQEEGPNSGWPLPQVPEE